MMDRNQKITLEPDYCLYTAIIIHHWLISLQKLLTIDHNQALEQLFESPTIISLEISLSCHPNEAHSRWEVI